MKQFAHENANKPWQAALRPYRETVILSDFIGICTDVGPAYVQGSALAAALTQSLGNIGGPQEKVEEVVSNVPPGA